MNRHPSATASAAAPRARRREGFSTGRWYPWKPNSAAGRWVLQEIGEALGALGGILRRAGGDRPRDMREFALDGGPQAPGAVAHQRIQARDGAFEPLHGSHQGVPAPPVVSEFDHLCHDDIMTPRSDTPSASVATPGRAAASHPHGTARTEGVDIRKLLITLIFATVVIALTPGAGQAGGSWIEFDGPLVVGTRVTGSGTFGNGQQAGVGAGPWFATLRAEEPGVDDIALGHVEVSRASSFGWRATVTFVVPEVPTGEYWVDIANDDGEGVGDLIGGFVVISTTPLEGRLWSRVTTAEAGRASANRSADRLRDRQGQLEETLSDRQATIERQAERLTAAGARITSMESDLDAATASTSTWLFWLDALMAVAPAFAGFALGRRYATRTLVTGASRSWAENQDAPASAEPNTSPLVAPK